MKTALALPLLLGCWLGAPLAAAPLVPPSGYYAPVPPAQPGAAPPCPATPTPHTGTLRFRSKYEGSDRARATLNPEAEQALRRQSAAIDTLERGIVQQVDRYLQDGQPAQLQCLLGWLERWAEADALRSDATTHPGRSMRKWALGSLAGAYLRLKFSRSQPLAAHPDQARRIEAWLLHLAEQVVRDWSDLPPEQINNHNYWSAWSVMASAVIGDRRDLFDWAVQQFHLAAQQVDAEGFLPHELARAQRALGYHNYSLPPLTLLAAFALANGVDLRGDNRDALQRLAQRVIEGLEDPAPFAAKTGQTQDLSGQREPSKLAWLAPYCALYRCPPAVRQWRAELPAFSAFRLGGAIGPLFPPR